MQLASEVGTAPACAAIGARGPHSTSSPSRGLSLPEEAAAHTAAHLSANERRVVLDMLHSERFVDQAPAEAYATLLDEGRYLCSIRTMYRLLHEAHEVRETQPTPASAISQARTVGHRAEPGLVLGHHQAAGPGSGRTSTCTSSWTSSAATWWAGRGEQESGQLAQRLIRETCQKENIEEGQLTIHADRGTSMTSRTVAQLLAVLGVIKSHSRPQVSNDNPFSESQFKTLKYRPEFPQRFASYDHGLTFCREFFPWYNQQHRHWGLGLLTPATVHGGRSAEALAARQKTLSAAYDATPERFVLRAPRPPRLPDAVWINPPAAPANSPENPLHALH